MSGSLRDKGEIRRPNYPEYDVDIYIMLIGFKVGMIFASIEDLRIVMNKYGIIAQRDIKYLKNDRKRIMVACNGNKCG